MKRLLLFLVGVQLSAAAFSQGVTLLYKGNQGWNDSASWIQIDAPAGQTPIQRVPTELDDVVFSKSMSELDYAGFGFAQGDSIEIGGTQSIGYRCRSMRISGMDVSFSAGTTYTPALNVYTSSGGHLQIDSGGNMSMGRLILHGGNDGIYDLAIIDSKYGSLFTHLVSSAITLKQKGRAKFVNSNCQGWGVVSELEGEIYAENSTFTGTGIVLGDSCKATFLDSKVLWGNNFPIVNFKIGRGAKLISRNVEIEAFNTVGLYTSGSVLNGNITTLDHQAGLRLQQEYPEHPLPNIVNGNLKIFGNMLDLSGDLKLSGDLINIAQEGDMYPDSSNVYINGQHIFKIGGISNYGNDTAIRNCPGCHFKLEFFGDGNSNVVWPVGFPIDTLVVNKTACGKVTFKNSIYVSGEAQIKNGQLSLTPNDTIPYKLVCAGDLNIYQGGGVFLRKDSTGAVANIAVNGTIRDFNTGVDSTCTGFSNPYNGKLTLYKNSPGGSNGIVMKAAANVGDMELIGDSTDFNLESNLIVNNFRFTNAGKLLLGDHDLTVNGSVLNFGAQNYFVTNGAGKLQLNNVGNSETVFPVGPSAASYNPLFITNSGTPDGFRVNVRPKVLSNGETGNPYVGGVVDRTWNVEEVTPGGSNATIKLQWNAEDELTGFDRSTAYLAHFITGTWDKGNLMVSAGTGPFSLTRNSITSFSPFAVLSPASTLPLKLVSFTGKPSPQGTMLQWTTESEQGVKSFSVERSSDRLSYITLATLPPSNQSGSKKNYSFYDDAFPGTQNYYRLKIIDLDGTFIYSNVVTVTSRDNHSLLVFPNPVKDQLFVQLNGRQDDVVLQIIDQKGMRVRTVKAKAGLNVAVINVSDLPVGVYSVGIEAGVKKQAVKFIKQ